MLNITKMEPLMRFLIGHAISRPSQVTINLGNIRAVPPLSFPLRAFNEQAFPGSQQLHGKVSETYITASATSLNQYTSTAWLNFCNCLEMSRLTQGKIRKRSSSSEYVIWMTLTLSQLFLLAPYHLPSHPPSCPLFLSSFPLFLLPSLALQVLSSLPESQSGRVGSLGTTAFRSQLCCLWAG